MKEYIRLGIERITEIFLPSADCSDCPWMNHAIAELGVSETANKSKVDEYKKAVSLSGDQPWCSGFVEWCMNRVHIDPTAKEFPKLSLGGARSWMAWGVAHAGPRFGAVTVLTRPPDPGSGHVAFYVGYYNKKILLRGGNQGDKVCVNSYEASRLIGYRWTTEHYINAVRKMLP